MLEQVQYLTIGDLGDQGNYGLPSQIEEPKIVSMVRSASLLIDQYCARQNVDGTGSLVWSTYTERLFTPAGRNLIRCTYRPLVAIDEATFLSFPASAHNLTDFNKVFTSDGRLAPLVSAQGRYGYRRRQEQQVYPDLNYGANILQIASYFGGPPVFTPIAINLSDFDPLTGEIWVPSGLYLSQYTEIEVKYNSGFPPNRIPAGVKHATALLVKNYLSRPATGMKGFGVGNVHHEFTEELIDGTIDRMLMPFKTVMAF